ncbi:hypothetical protein E4Q23_19540 [Candidatus Accumulibacter phosphatis]|jgi:hypothetical protein|uniref:Bacterial repeat domain-containing protein n=1 Tax=Candidatus Accumulibacter phosphatis TaxID=327160 RepID=A0ABX1U4I0_9PROT|nr:HET-C-related protein [Candidatus Accumulibacter phosphatis]NMQ29763.1 hypothetical protein [Candidatus Accumulibacter phosphatis]
MNLVNVLSPLRIVACAFLIHVCLAPGEASAFGVKKLFGLPGTPNHELITRAGLTGVMPLHLSSGQVVMFTPAAITQIADANVSTDSVYAVFPSRHFDEESFGGGQSLLVSERDEIVRKLILAKDDGDEARHLLGRALHTLQDFYAHSTWVEVGHTGTAPLGQRGISIPHADLFTHVCDRFGVLSGRALTSDYWTSSNLLGWKDYDLVIALGTGVHKCGHGNGDKCNDPTKCPGDFDKDGHLLTDAGGINKDTDERAHFVEALLLARESSAEYVEHILSDVGTDMDATVRKCKLMGQSCYILFLQKGAIGSGTIVVSDPPAMDINKSCGVDCSLVVRSGTLITLEAKADPGFEFLGWSEDCAAQGTTNPVRVTFSSLTLCKANFGVLPTVHFKPYGSHNVAGGPFYVELVDAAALSPITASQDVTVTVLRQVYTCDPPRLRFSSNRVIAIPAGLSVSADLTGYVAGRDPLCSPSLPARTDLIIMEATLGTRKLTIDSVPEAQRKVFITR